MELQAVFDVFSALWLVVDMVLDIITTEGYYSKAFTHDSRGRYIVDWGELPFFVASLAALLLPTAIGGLVIWGYGVKKALPYIWDKIGKEYPFFWGSLATLLLPLSIGSLVLWGYGSKIAFVYTWDKTGPFVLIQLFCCGLLLLPTIVVLVIWGFVTIGLLVQARDKLGSRTVCASICFLPLVALAAISSTIMAALSALAFVLLWVLSPILHFIQAIYMALGIKPYGIPRGESEQAQIQVVLSILVNQAQAWIYQFFVNYKILEMHIWQKKTRKLRQI